jgi:uncharacterized protein DUF4129
MDGRATPEGLGATSGRRASLTALAGVLGAVALMLMMLTWAASIGPDEIVAGGRAPSYETITPTVTEDADAAGRTRDRDGESHPLLWMIITITATVLASVVILAAALNVVRWLLTRNWHTYREPEPDEIAFDTIGVPALARAVAEGAQDQRRALSEGSPRNAIVECWHRFEQQAASVGVHRFAWETSSEFTLRVLDDLSADTAAVTELADLYRDARHSQHEITEEMRGRARAALDRIYRSTGTPTAAP